MLLSGGCSTKYIYIFALFSRKEATLKYKTQPCLNLKKKYLFFWPQALNRLLLAQPASQMVDKYKG